MNKEKPLVIVLSRNYSTGLGVIRSLGIAGYTVDLIASTKKKGSSIIASCSKYVRTTTEVMSKKIQGDNGIELLDALMKYVGKTDIKPIVFPTDDFTASVVDAHRDVLCQHFLIPGVNGKQGISLTDSMDKTFQTRLANSAGMITPKEWIVSLNEEVQQLKEITYPCFVKPLTSISGHKTEMKVCVDSDELEQHLHKMKMFYEDRAVLVQEYLNIEKEYSLSGVCLDQQVIIPAVIEKKRTAKYERGVAVTGKMVSVDVLGSNKERLVEMLKQLHYVGMFDVDLIYSNHQLYFTEVNLRSGGSNFAYTLSGANLADIFIKEVTGIGHSKEEEQICLGKSFVYEKVAWEDYIYGHMSRSDLRRCIEEADFKLLNYEGDPAPGKCFEKRIRLSALKQKAKKCFRKLKSKRDDLMKLEDRAVDVVVIGRNYGNILTMTRALGRAGYSVHVVRLFKKKQSKVNPLGRLKPDAYSKYVKKYIQCIADPMERVVALLENLELRAAKTLLIPVDDFSAYVVDAHFNQLHEKYYLPNIENQEGRINALMDKDKQKQLAKVFGLPVLQSCLIQSQNGLFQIPKGIIYPCFIKPNVSMKNNKAMMRKCDDEKSLHQVLTKYAQKGDFEVLVEEFADIKAEYSILGVSTEHGIISPGMFKAILGGHRERKGVAMMGELLPCAEFGEIVKLCEGFIQSLQYTGMYDVDLIETTTGDVYFVELNYRAGASMHALTELGINLPALYADSILHEGTYFHEKILFDKGKVFINEKILLEELIRSDVGISDAKKYMEEADIYFMKDNQDSKPYRHFKAFYPIALLMRIPYKIRDLKARG